MDKIDPGFLTALDTARRVMIIGQAGSGKSYLAQKLGPILGLPVVHIDKIHWKPGWEPRAWEDKLALTQEVHAQETWIFEGGMSPTWAERLDRCHALIWLDLPIGVRLLRIGQRTWHSYGKTRPDLADNCPERISFDFYRFVVRSRRQSHRRNQKFFEEADKPKLKLGSARSVAAFLDQIRVV